MVPSEYRLEQVTGRLAERLESTRRSYADDPDKAAAEFLRIADEVLDDVVAEFRDNGFTDHPERHEQLLRHEVRETFLPRYTRMATAMTAREDSGYGMRWLYGPVGRLAIGAVSLLLMFAVLRFPAPSVKFALLPALLSTVMIPDVVAWSVRRRYRKNLVAVFRDMSTIQDRAGDYLPIDTEERDIDPPRVSDTARRAAAKAKQRR